MCLIHSGLQPVPEFEDFFSFFFPEFEDIVSSDNNEGSALVPVLKRIPPSSLHQLECAEGDTFRVANRRLINAHLPVSKMEECFCAEKNYFHV